MTNMTDQTPNGPQGPTAPVPPHQLRRSRTDRVVTGVAGGLGEYFGIDPVIFRVLFAVLTFFGGAGLAAYLVFWVLVPEADVEVSVLDKSVEQLRVRRIPPWVVIAGGALLIWLMWFSWWQPGPSFPAFVVLAAILIYLTHRAGRAAPHAPGGYAAAPGGYPAPQAYPPPQAHPADQPHPTPQGYVTDQPYQTPGYPTEQPYPTDQPYPTEQTPLIAPLSDPRRSMQAWFTEANAAHRERVLRRRPVKVAVALALAAGWGIAALADLSGRISFGTYIWIGLAVVSTGLLASIVLRRATWSLIPAIVFLTAAAIFMGSTSASLRDGSGQISWRPPSAASLSDQHQFAGETTIDLRSIRSIESPRTITITQGAGRVLLRLPASLNATVRAQVHVGEIQLGSSRTPGDFVNGWNVRFEVPPAAGATTGAELTIDVRLTVGQIQVERG